MANDRRTIHVGTRMNEAEYAEFMLKNMDENGKPIMSKSDFIRTALVGSTIKVSDLEVEQYKCFILSKINNNLHQLVTRLHEDHKAEKVGYVTYSEVLTGLVKINDDVLILTAPLR